MVFRRARAFAFVSVLLLIAGSLSGCSSASAQNPGEKNPAAPSATPGPPAPTPAPTESFYDFLAGIRSEALGKGIAPATLDAALNGVTPIDRVIELDRRQPEFTLTFDQYLSRTVTADRVVAARARYAENKALLDAVGRRYGVQPRFIVALWGLETNFGRSTGGFSVVASLATLAYEGRRAAYFRDELMNALEIIDQGHVKAADMKGSWAGAMGQSQFMPSTSSTTRSTGTATASATSGATRATCSRPRPIT
jgi:membrane-bound lytic murein transglycosylase B